MISLPIIPPQVKIAAVAIAAAWVFFLGYRLGDARTDRVVNKIQNHTIKMVQQADVITQASGVKAVEVQTRIRTVTQTIHDQVKVYVPITPSCDVPVGFVRVFNASAEGIPVPEPSGQPNDAPSGIGLPEVADTVVTNAGLYHEVAAQLAALQQWVRDQQSLALKGGK